MELRSSRRRPLTGFSRSEVQNWFMKKQEHLQDTSLDVAKNSEALTQNNSAGNFNIFLFPEIPIQNNSAGNPIPNAEGEEGNSLSNLEFEARSSRDGAWYDVDKFLSHRCLRTGEIEVHVRFVGFGAEEDEWVNVEDAVRERSVTLEHWECQKVKVGDLVLCFQERQDKAKYYDAHVMEILRRWHDIRGCRCRFLIRYDHNKYQETVQLRRLCCRPSMLGSSDTPELSQDA